MTEQSGNRVAVAFMGITGCLTVALLLGLLACFYAFVAWLVVNIVLSGIFDLLDPLKFWQLVVVGWAFAVVSGFIRGNRTSND